MQGDEGEAQMRGGPQLQVEKQKEVMHLNIRQACLSQLHLDASRSTLAADQRSFLSNCTERMAVSFQIFYNAFSQTNLEMSMKDPQSAEGKQFWSN